MPTVFIALQCYHCSTMQVKQQKKSSNKWTCVVCNQRQSVTRIYARALMAKDVRSFVQTFNMSRFAIDQQISNNPIQDPPLCDGTQTLEPRLKKRTDWAEFIPPEVDTLSEINNEKGNAFEPNVVTELPKEMFTKPKLKNALKGSCNDDNGYKPVFQKRNNSRKRSCNDMKMEPNERQQMMRQGSDELNHTMVPAKESAKFQQSMGTSRRKVYETQGGDYDYERYEMTRQQKMTAGVSFRCNGNRVEDGCNNGSGDFPEKEYAKSQFAAIALKWKGNGGHSGQHEKGSESIETLRDQKKKTSTVSKWDDYITEDDDDDEAGGYSGNMLGTICRDVLDPTSNWNSNMYDMILGDQKVEEDVHPDFL